MKDLKDQILDLFQAFVGQPEEISAEAVATALMLADTINNLGFEVIALTDQKGNMDLVLSFEDGDWNILCSSHDEIKIYPVLWPNDKGVEDMVQAVTLPEANLWLLKRKKKELETAAEFETNPV